MQSKFKNYLAFLILLSVLVAPSFALAAWWNPFSWGMWRRISIFYWQPPMPTNGKSSPTATATAISTTAATPIQTASPVAMSNGVCGKCGNDCIFNAQSASCAAPTENFSCKVVNGNCVKLNNVLQQTNPGSGKICSSDSECMTGEKCFECHGVVPDNYKPIKHCWTEEKIKIMQAACAAM